MLTKIYTAAELPADRYHSAEFPQASGSVLQEIFAYCPAQYKFGEKKETAALSFGVASHCMVLEHSEFDNRFVRGINPAEHEGILITNDDLKSFIKEVGAKIPSGLNKAQLLQFIHDIGERPVVIDWLERDLIASHPNKQIVKFCDYDAIKIMRETLVRNGYGYIIDNDTGQSEVSIIDEDLQLKCRIDRILNLGNGQIWDYKSTRDVRAEQFGNQALQLGYWLKMALQADLFEMAYGHLPDKVGLLAQCTSAPYIPVGYELTADQLNKGREFYQGAKRIWDESHKTGRWGSYAAPGEILPLPTPRWAAYEYEMDTEQVTLIEG